MTGKTYLWGLLLRVETPRGPWTYSVQCFAHDKAQAEEIAREHVLALSAPGCQAKVLRAGRFSAVPRSEAMLGTVSEARGRQGIFAARI